jgi:hypothetical protein
MFGGRLTHRQAGRQAARVAAGGMEGFVISCLLPPAVVEELACDVSLPCLGAKSHHLLFPDG